MISQFLFIYITDDSNDRINVFDAKGKYLRAIPIRYGPQDIELDLKGNLYSVAFGGGLGGAGCRTRKYEPSALVDSQDIFPETYFLGGFLVRDKDGNVYLRGSWGVKDSSARSGDKVMYAAMMISEMNANGLNIKADRALLCLSPFEDPVRCTFKLGDRVKVLPPPLTWLPRFFEDKEGNTIYITDHISERTVQKYNGLQKLVFQKGFELSHFRRKGYSGWVADGIGYDMECSIYQVVADARGINIIKWFKSK